MVRWPALAFWRGLKRVRATLRCVVLSAPKRWGGRLSASGRLIVRSLKRFIKFYIQ